MTVLRILKGMWTQHTREKAARRGWTLGAMSIAFVGTVGLAKVLVDHRADEKMAAVKQSLPGWPIEFELPAGRRWIPEDDMLARIKALVEENYGTAVYSVNSPWRSPSILHVQYQIVSSDTTARRAAMMVFDLPFKEFEEVELGSLSWQVNSNKDEPVSGAVACTPEGVAVCVTYAGPSGRKGDVVESVCRSVEVKSLK